MTRMLLDRIPRTAWLLLCASSLIGLAYLSSRNYNGYCPARGRTLSDSEIIQAAVGFNANNIGIENDEQAVRAFIAAHPDCCRVDRTSSQTSGAMARLTGSYWIVAELTFEVRPERVRPGLRHYRQFVEISACGDRGEMYGEYIK